MRHLQTIPLARVNGADVAHVHGINLLKSTVLGLDNEKEHNENEDTAASGKYKAVQVVNLVGNEASEEGQHKVPEPVGGSGQTHAGTAVTQRVQLGVDTPDQRSPTNSKSGNGETREGNEDATGCGGLGGINGVEGEVADKGVDEERHHHPSSTDHENGTATEALDDPQTSNGAHDVDGAENDLGGVAVLDTGGGEDGGTEVEEEVGTSKLLASLENNTKSGAEQHARASEDLSEMELGRALALLVQLGLDVGNLLVDNGAVGRQTDELRDGLASLFDAALGIGIARGLGEEENTSSEEQCPSESQTVGNAPCGTVGVGLVSAPVDHFSSPNTKGDQKLVRRDNDTADFGGCTLGLVHRDDDRHGTNAKTGDETAHGELNPVVRRGDFDRGTDASKEGGSGDGKSTTDEISKLASNQGTEEGSDTEETNDGTLTGGAEFVHSAAGEGTESLGIVVHWEEAGNLTTNKKQSIAGMQSKVQATAHT